MALLGEQPDLSPVDLLERCDVALQGTRGAVLAAVHLDLARRELLHAGAGNVATHVYGPGAANRLPSANRTLGARGPGRRLRATRTPFGAHDVLVMYTDGLSSRLDLSDDPALLREPAMVIAHTLLERFGGSSDDALVLVAR
jgi:hypothetical protein